MDKIFILNPSHIDLLQLNSAIQERIIKAKAITNFILANNTCTNLYDLVWAVDTYLDEINCLQERLDKISDLVIKN